jgi:hypothetical protein
VSIMETGQNLAGAATMAAESGIPASVFMSSATVPNAVAQGIPASTALGTVALAYATVYGADSTPVAVVRGWKV